MTKLYLISPPNIAENDDSFADFCLILESVLATGLVSVFQLRLKGFNSEAGYYTNRLPNEVIEHKAKLIQPICAKYNCWFILNDNVEIAKKIAANGVHLGDEDMSVTQAREIIGEEAIIGASCYGSKDRAYTACKQGADYVAFGTFYDTKTKESKGRPTPELLEFWRDYTNVPSVAIGGIKVSNVEPLVKAGADFVAVVTGVWDYERGAVQAVRDFADVFKNYSDFS